jgi:hypothetical protein
VEIVIIVDRPPNFEQIQAAFPKSVNPGVLFAYDGNIYNPSGIVVPPALIAHEEVHLHRQTISGADLWWTLYLESAEYRYREELLAHVAEFKMQRGVDRNQVARLLLATALRLIAPLYNYQPPVSLQRAMKDLKQEIGK